jgi:hypothetical protein
MKRALIGLFAGFAAAASVASFAAPYEDYKMQIQRVQEAKLKGSPQGATSGLDEHMPLMQEMQKQMRDARSVDQMSPEQMRDWIKHHAQLMDQMHQKMMGEHGQMMGNQAPMMGGQGSPSRPAQ